MSHLRDEQIPQSDLDLRQSRVLRLPDVNDAAGRVIGDVNANTNLIAGKVIDYTQSTV